MQCKYPGQALDVSLVLSLGITGHQNPPVCARAIFDWLRLLKVVENGPHGHTRMSSWVSFNNATWHGDSVLRMHWQAVPAPWATLGTVPSFFASSTSSGVSYLLCSLIKNHV